MRILRLWIAPLVLVVPGCSFEPRYNIATESEAAAVTSEKTASPSMGWVVVLAGLGINLALGVLYTWSVVTATLTKSFKVGAEFQDGNFNTIKPARENSNGVNFNGNVTSLNNPSAGGRGATSCSRSPPAAR